MNFSPDGSPAPANAKPFRYGSLGRDVVRPRRFGDMDMSKIIQNLDSRNK